MTPSPRPTGDPIPGRSPFSPEETPHGGLPSGPRPPEPSSSEPGEALSPVARAVLHEVTETLQSLEGRAALARSPGNSHLWAAGELRRVQEEAEEFRGIVDLLLGGDRGPASPEGQRFSLASAVESAVDRWLPTSPGIMAQYQSTIPEGSAVLGPPALLARGLRSLLRAMARRARSRIRVELATVPGPEAGEPGAQAQIRLSLDGDWEGADGLREETGSGEGDPGRGGSMAEELRRDPSVVFARWAIQELRGRLEGPATLPGAPGTMGFTAVLPLAPRAPRPIRRGRSWSAGGVRGGPLEGVRVAVVDDEPALRSVLARLLHRAGADVTTLAPELGDPVAALARRLLADAPDLILLDLHLGRISGRDLLKLLGEREGPAILILTGDPGGAAELGLPVVAKPVDWPLLVRRIQECLARPDQD